jgi:histone deacetylase complex regulatory component SIN3
VNRYQFDFIFKNSSVFPDCESILINYIDSMMTLSQNDEDKMKSIVRDFLPDFFLLESEEDGDAKKTFAPKVEVQAMMDVDTPADEKDLNIRKRSTYSFYANTSLYALFRLYQVLSPKLDAFR